MAEAAEAAEAARALGEHLGTGSRRGLELAEQAARLELDAAAGVEIDQLNAAMAAASSLQDDAEAAAAAVTAAALQRLQDHRGSSAYNLWFKRE